MSTGLVVFVSLLSLTVAQEKYADCFTNYSVLEQAILETGDNRFEIINAFYSPDSSLPSVYVIVNFKVDGEILNDTRIWTRIPIYLILPASVFQYMSLLFVHHFQSDQVAKLTIELPRTCCNETPSLRCSQCNNKYLNVLTNDLYSYAQYNGKNSPVIQNAPSVTIRKGLKCSDNHIYEQSFYLLNLSCVFFPIAVYFLMWILIHSCRPRIRVFFSPSTSKSTFSQNYTAVLLTGMVFSFYVVVCDSLALYNSIKSDSELKTLDFYEEEKIHQLTRGSVATILALDSLAFLLSALHIVVWFVITTCGKLDKRHRNVCTRNLFVNGVFCFYCTLFCKCLKCDNIQGDYDHEYELLTTVESGQGSDDGEGSDGQGMGPGGQGGDRQGGDGQSHDNKIYMEHMSWILSFSFLAPLVCFGTHTSYVVLAWSSDPAGSGNMTLVFVLSFFYYFLGFRQLYTILASCPCFQDKREDRSVYKQVCSYVIQGIGDELSEHHESLGSFNFIAFFLVISIVGGSLICIHLFFLFMYIYLPSPVNAIPANILNILQLALLVGSGLIAYKLLTVHTPAEDVILEKLVSAYDGKDNKASDERVGEILGRALKKYIPPEQSGQLAVGVNLPPPRNINVPA